MLSFYEWMQTEGLFDKIKEKITKSFLPSYEKAQAIRDGLMGRKELPINLSVMTPPHAGLAAADYMSQREKYYPILWKFYKYADLTKEQLEYELTLWKKEHEEVKAHKEARRGSASQMALGGMYTAELYSRYCVEVIEERLQSMANT